LPKYVASELERRVWGMPTGMPLIQRRISEGGLMSAWGNVRWRESVGWEWRWWVDRSAWITASVVKALVAMHMASERVG